MIPDVQTVLNGVARTALMDLGPAASTPYAGFTTQLMSVLLMMIAQEHERGAARLQEENEALAQLFRAAAPVVVEAELQAACSAAEARAASLRISDLTARNRELRNLLIRLHAHVETLDGPAARDVETKIWGELVASTQRRHLDLANG